MKKNLFIIGIISATALSSTCFAADVVNVVLDGKQIDFDVPAQIVDNRTLVPVRGIFEALGMTIDWNDETRTVLAYKDGVYIELPIDSYTVYHNTIELSIDVPAQIIDGRTLVPVRLISECAGAVVDWDSDTRSVRITPTDNIQRISFGDNYEYCGEVVNGKASGYGMLYEKEDDLIVQMGIYTDSQIVEGSNLCSNGDVFIGSYENGEYSKGTYYYSNGDEYSGEFKDGHRHGEGTYTGADGSFHKGTWENDIPNGYGTFYDSIANVQYYGNFINGKRDGRFAVDDLRNNKTSYVSYDNDEVIDEKYIKSKNEAKYKQEHDELISWAKNEMEEIYKNADQVYQDVLKEEMDKAYAKYDTTPDENGNIDSFAAANAKRQTDALMSKIKSAAENKAELAKEVYLVEKLELLAQVTQEAENQLKTTYNIK